MLNFRVYYERGSFQGDAYLAPGRGVLLIVERDQEHGRRIISNGDYYVWDERRWWAKDFIGLVDYLLEPGPRKVLIGRMVDNRVWESVYRKAEADTDFPVRTGFGAFERVKP